MRLLRAGGDFSALRRLALVSRKRATSHLPGRRGGVSTGHGIDFADYRRYSPGDDVRSIDWTLFSRLGMLFSRAFQADSELRVHLLLDVSTSMRYGEADKLDCARRLAAAVSWVGLKQLDVVGLATFSDRLHRVLPPRRTKEHFHRLLAALEEVEPRGRSGLTRALRDYGSRAQGGGLAVILSDFLSSDGYAQGLDYLLYRKFELLLIQVVADEELDPPSGENVELEDCEEPRLPRVAALPEVLSRYRENRRAFQASLALFCRRRHVALVQAVTSRSFGELVCQLLREGVWERR